MAIESRKNNVIYRRNGSTYVMLDVFPDGGEKPFTLVLYGGGSIDVDYSPGRRTYNSVDHELLFSFGDLRTAIDALTKEDS